uniref:Helicase C-terminal domain-containing protein n=1 Tax=Anopheles epiroticus TaxID=199890 RepID=A0A182PQI4_9DIPT
MQLDPQMNVKACIRAIQRVPEYELHERTNDANPDTVLLSIFLRMLNQNEEICNGCQPHRLNLVKLLFEELERQTFVDQELETPSAAAASEDGQTGALSIPQFYERLRLHHRVQSVEKVSANLPQTLKHPHLRPELRTYQQQAIRWMVARETVPESLPAQYTRLCSRVPIPDVEFFMNVYDYTISDKKPEPIPLPVGGILADEMGLEPDEDNSNPKRRYICPECWRSEPMVKSGATIIVTPASIKLQWMSEIRKHVSDPNFRVFVYNGIADSWISPLDLASYDVVLTDYNILQPEIYLLPENERTSRHEKRFLRVPSPLTLIRWWRVCLDEAQMVESVNKNATKMVKALPAVHRWTVTGTPIEKSIDNLYGLVHYLDYEPYNKYWLWRQYTDRFQKGNAEPLLTIMARVMWRTCKNAVLSQLGIPPQTERIHLIQMSDLQSYFYRSEHMQCAQAFHEKARKIGTDQRMAQLDISTLNRLMEPLRKLRMDCSMPSILGVGQSALQGKKLLTPTELHEHLVTTATNDCKGKLRSIVSSLNGMAAVEILQDHFDQAFRYYQASLRFADDYQGAISVDSLLQIHALHNLLDLVRTFEEDLSTTLKPSDEQIAAYEERRARLEWRYIEQYASKVRTIEATLLPAIQKADELIVPANDKPVLRLEDGWWHNLFVQFENNHQRYSAIYSRVLHDQNMLNNTGVNSWRTLDLWLMNWLDNLMRRRSSLKLGFESLAFFLQTLQPNQTWSEDVRNQTEKLVRSAYACHLDPSLFEEDENGMRTAERVVAIGQQKAPECLLCNVKEKLNMLESVLFLIRQTQVATGGLWQVSNQEQVLKLIHQYVKRQDEFDEAIVSASDHFMTFLERVKIEFKEYSQYWVEINYTVAAYDELSMCKSRLQLISAARRLELQGNLKKRTPLELLKHELPSTMEDLQLAKAEAERDFVRLQGTIKYLEHLGVRKELDPCPICQVVPEGKYAVLHLQYVQQNDPVHNVRGSFSSKIGKIVQTVLELLANEPTVKIVIFSHWESLLSELGVALAENSVTFVEKATKFQQQVENFKNPENGITCLLLPLRFGSKGLNLTEATHVFLVEPILNPGEEMQAIGRVHRIGQTRPTFVHRFIMRDTIETTIHETIQSDRSGRWLTKDVTRFDQFRLQSSYLLIDVDHHV